MSLRVTENYRISTLCGYICCIHMKRKEKPQLSFWHNRNKNKAQGNRAQCGNYRNLLSQFFDRYFVKATFLLKKLLNSWFHETFFWWEQISRFFPLWNRDSGDHFLNVSLVVNKCAFFVQQQKRFWPFLEIFSRFLETFFLPGHHPFTTGNTTGSRFKFAAKILFKIFVHSRVNNTLLAQGPRVGG